MKVRAHVIFIGRVQGVFFRANCMKEAKNLGLSGFVRNLPNGDVEAVFEGEKELVEKAIEWNKTLQPSAIVKDARIEWGDASDDFDGFSIRY